VVKDTFINNLKIPLNMTQSMYNRIVEPICRTIEGLPSGLQNIIEWALTPAKDETWALKREFRAPNGTLPTDAELPYVLERHEKRQIY